MIKDDSGGLLIKVAKFVRNPLKDWSELDAQGAATPQDAYSRKMLKEMIERRQRNDFARRREFDMLRKLRQRKLAPSTDAAALSSSFNMGVSSRSSGRALTLKKIDEIEEQMSQQWWKGRAPAPAPGDELAETPEALAMPHARAYAKTEPFVTSSVNIDAGLIDPVAEPTPRTTDRRPSRLVADTAIEEAAIRFAHGDDAGCEAILLQTIAPGNPGADHGDSWLALLDMYRATDALEKFERVRLGYVQRFGRLGPRWVSLRLLAHDALATADQLPAPVLAATGAHWVCPARLARADLSGLTRALSAAGAVWDLDWHALSAIDADAVPALKALFTHWGDSAVQLRFLGAQQLLAVLASATPTNERRTPVEWWDLRMGVLRAMHDVDGFELVALNYCLTYEMSPPAWQEPRGRFVALEEPSAAARQDAMPQMALAQAAPAALPAADCAPGHAVLAGDLSGDTLATWLQPDAELADADPSVINCAALLRMDLVAGAALLEWVRARDARGERIDFVEAHLLIAAFFNIVGIADHATIATRKD
ncbi:MAG: hypothetical protein JWQ03_243 [Variovorax sp.]|nr:hypothetical protein [Variovorax sp.]